MSYNEFAILCAKLRGCDWMSVERSKEHASKACEANPPRVRISLSSAVPRGFFTAGFLIKPKTGWL